MWRKYIDRYLIDRYLEKLFEECGHSVFYMERKISDFINGSDKKNEDIEELNEELNEKLKWLKKERNDLRSDLIKKELRLKKAEVEKMKANEKLEEAENDRDRMVKLYSIKKRKFDELKNNSIVFSMDD